MMAGEIIQIGTPQEIYTQPQALSVAEFLGSPKINTIVLKDKAITFLKLNTIIQTRLFVFGPAIILMILIFFVPILMALGLSFTNYSLWNSRFSFVALDNYEKIFTRRSYENMWNATFTYMLVVVPLSVITGLLAALAVNSLTHFRDLYKTIYFLPVMATFMAMAIVWQIMLHPTAGVINRSLASGCEIDFVYGILSGKFFGMDPSQSWYGAACVEVMPNWLGDKKYAIWVICFIGVWQNFGFNMVLYLAGLTSVSRDLY